MIVDVHSHTWQYPTHFNNDFRQQARRARAGVRVDLTVRYEEYLAGATASRFSDSTVDTSIASRETLTT